MGQAFSLLELLIVLAVTAILIALLLAAMLPARQKARTAACASNLRQIDTGFEVFYAERDEVPIWTHEVGANRFVCPAPEVTHPSWRRYALFPNLAYHESRYAGRGGSEEQLRRHVRVLQDAQPPQLLARAADMPTELAGEHPYGRRPHHNVLYADHSVVMHGQCREERYD